MSAVLAAGGYDVVWRSPSADSGASMPCGGHDVGLNVWVEDGRLRFYVDRSGSFDENNLMLKLGRVVVDLEPNPFAAGAADFEQRLDLHRGRVVVSGRVPDGLEVRVTVWCETGAPAVHVDVEATAPVIARVAYQGWRFADRVVPDEQRVACYSVRGRPGDIVTYADTVGHRDGGVLFAHRNRNDANCFQQVVELENLGRRLDDLWNPQRNLVFGGFLLGEGFEPDGSGEGAYAGVPYREWRLASTRPSRTHAVVVGLHSERTPDLGAWEAAAVEHGRRSLTGAAAAEREATAFWAALWERSAVDVRPASPGPGDPDWQVGRNYNLFRYLLACNARGEHPTKFNGGLFTTDTVFSVPSADYGTPTPDFRIWGGGSATMQNQRLVYWPMLRSGDLDMMRPQFEFYRRALGNATIRTREYWGHGGASFCEQLENFGLPIGYEWGWDSDLDESGDYPRRPWHDPTELVRPWVRHHYSTQLEICFMILERHQYGGEPVDDYLPLIDACVTFFDEHYRMRHYDSTGSELTTAGELVIFPSTALETYKDATNPTDAVAGLRAVLDALLGPSVRGLLDDATAARYERLLASLPAQAFRVVDGVTVLAPAQSFSDIMNVELPQLYPVFPYATYGVGRPDLHVAVDTYDAPADIEGQRDHVSWHQDGIFAARLGLVDEAVRVARLKLADGPRRFPAFWGPGHDWVPDHNWGGSGMIGVQEMLLQSVDDALLVLPSWPDDLDVDFRLHAPASTVVDVSYRSGAVVRCDVTPVSRAADVVLFKPARLPWQGWSLAGGDE